jgi:hypothetical protein
MLTIFTVAKPFRGHFATIQRNAIASWARLQPSCQILLLGNEEGIAEIAAETGATHLPELERNDFGTPLVSSIFSEAEKHARFDHLCYINADILLLNDFLPAVQKICAWNSRSLVIGRRWDVDITESLTWETGREGALRARVRTAGKLHPHTGSDYFGFHRNFWGAMPHFVAGHCGYWDNWLIFRARTLGVPVVDATKCVTAIHQNHENSFYHASGEARVSWDTERQQNYALGGGLKHACTVRDATHLLTSSGVSRRLIPFDLHRCLIVPFVKQKWARPFVRVKKALFPDAGPVTQKEAP